MHVSYCFIDFPIVWQLKKASESQTTPWHHALTDQGGVTKVSYKRYLKTIGKISPKVAWLFHYSTLIIIHVLNRTSVHWFPEKLAHAVPEINKN